MWLRGFPLLWGCFQGDQLGQNGDFDLADKVEDDFHRLPTVPGGLVRFVDDDLFHKFVHDGGGQLGDVHVLFHQGSETIIQRWYLASGNTSPTASSIPRHLSPTMSFTPSRPRPFSHLKKLTQLALSSFIPSAAPSTSRYQSLLTVSSYFWNLRNLLYLIGLENDVWLNDWILY